MESLDWVGDDVWFAHSVHVNQDEIDVYARTGCGVAHCPCSNMRLASGIAPIREMRAASVPVGLGVDGSASNDASHLLAEARQALLLARVRAGVEGASLTGSDAPIMTAREVLEIATIGGAQVLGRTDIGSLEVGKCADFIAIDMNRLEFAGAQQDPLAAVLFCNAVNVDFNVVGGKFVVRDRVLQTLDLPTHIEKHNRAAARLVEG
jgi:cytosine/adenosine deaminase-related metal-dependent hydrolase